MGVNLCLRISSYWQENNEILRVMQIDHKEEVKAEYVPDVLMRYGVQVKKVGAKLYATKENITPPRYLMGLISLFSKCSNPWMYSTS